MRIVDCTIANLQGKVSLLDPEQQHTYQERSAVMEHDGGLSRDHDDKSAWCREICMLTLGQREQCEVVMPCPKGCSQ